MVYFHWRDAVTALRETTGPLTAKQKKLAALAGTALPDDLPRLVAGARLQSELFSELGLPAAGLCSFFQAELISTLGGSNQKIISELMQNTELFAAPFDRREAGAWIAHLRLLVRLRALEQLQIEAGDVVSYTETSGEVDVVASIGSDGRVYFTGGMGAGAWPDRLTVRARKFDTSQSANDVRRKADNRAAHRKQVGDFSPRKHRELEPFEVKSLLIMEDIDALQSVIESSEDETAIQKTIEERPQILAALLGGEARFLIPRKSLGGMYVPDFLAADYDSAGVRWLLVELETPRSSITLKDRNGLERHARTGVDQIKEWREWLQNNLDVARRSKRDDGLGLVDIRPRSEGLVLVGRRGNLHDNSHKVRRPIEESDHIRIHTYDWLVEQLVGLLNYSGPFLNPYIIYPLRGDDDSGQQISSQ